MTLRLAAIFGTRVDQRDGCFNAGAELNGRRAVAGVHASIGSDVVLMAVIASELVGVLFVRAIGVLMVLKSNLLNFTVKAYTLAEC